MMRAAGQGRAGGLMLGHNSSVSAGNLRATLISWRDVHPNPPRIRLPSVTWFTGRIFAASSKSRISGPGSAAGSRNREAGGTVDLQMPEGEAEGFFIRRPDTQNAARAIPEDHRIRGIVDARQRLKLHAVAGVVSEHSAEVLPVAPCRARRRGCCRRDRASFCDLI
jgi:hypothetical protein